MHLLRKLVFVLGVSLLLASQVQALGVGGSELHSALNQPLRADIELTNLGDLREDDIIVSLASNADFERAGIDRLMFYSQLDFELMLDHPEGPRILVTTREPVREPYLNFLLELRWASGRLIREYTFLLDLPTFEEGSDSAAGQVVQAVGRADRSAGREELQSSRSAASQSRQEDTRRQARASTRVADGSYGPVGSNDTLWEIALQVRPDRGLSVQQTMLALQRKNPEAFINGNINLLREGQILRLPSRQEIEAVSQRQAVSQVAQHNRDWSANKTGAQLDASGRQAGSRSTGGEPEGQLRLATPTSKAANKAGQGGGANEGEGRALASELAATQEELDKTRRENRELAARVEDLESQIDTMERLIEASNEQLRALQAASKRNQQQEGLAEEGAQSAQPSAQPQPKAADGAEPQETQQSNRQGATAETQVAASQSEAEQAPDQSDKRVVRSVPQNKSWLDMVMDNLMWLAGAALALLLLIYYGYRRRNQKQVAAKDQEPLDSEAFESEEPFALGLDEDEGYEQEPMQEESLPSEGDDYELAYNEAEDTQDQVEAETGDAVAEADIYIAYGKLDQAEELLLQELKKDPRAPEVLAKLLELYAEKQDVESFDQHYATLLGTDDRNAIQRAGELREMIPGVSPFDVSALEAAPNEPRERDSDLDQPIDLGEDTENLDFDIGDLDSDAESPEPQTEKSETESATGGPDQDPEFEFDLDEDFDFDLGELDENTQPPGESHRHDHGELNLEQEPSAGFDKEPSAELDEEPSAGFDKEPSAEFNEEPSAELDEEPSAGFDKEPSAEFEEEPSAEFEEEPSAASEEDPGYELDGEDDDLSFDWEDAGSTTKDSDTGSMEDDFPELNVSLDDLPTDENEAITDPTSEKAEPGAIGDEGEDEALDEWDLELEPDEQSLSALDNELSDLDQLDEEESDQNQQATPVEETVAQGPEADFDALEYDEPDAQAGDEALEADSESDSETSDLNRDLSGPDSGLDEQESLSSPQTTEADTEIDLIQDQASRPDSGETDSLSEQDDEDAVFEEALSGLDEQESPKGDQNQELTTGGEFQPEEGERSEESMDEELDFLADTDEAATKLDLARAYIDMGDADGARDILEEVAQEGDAQQKQEAQELLGRI